MWALNYSSMKQLILASLFLVPLLLKAQPDTISRNYTIQSTVFGTKRTFSVFIPEAYKKDTSKRLAVAYVFDGQFEPYFTMVSSIMSYYEQTGEGVPMIVVGIHTNNRWEEFVPVCPEEQPADDKGAHLLTQFLQKEVDPLIRSTYRTAGFTVGIGHSLGGTFVLQELYKDSSLFDAVIAVSPNLTMCNEKITTDAIQFLTKNPDSRKFAYTTCGTNWDIEKMFGESLFRMDKAMRKLRPNNPFWYCNKLENLNHMTTFVTSFDAGYRVLSGKMTLLDDPLEAMAKDTTARMPEKLIAFYKELDIFTHESHPLTLELMLSYSAKLSEIGAYRGCLEMCDYITTLLDTASLSRHERKEIEETISNRQLRARFNLLGEEARQEAFRSNYQKAAELYLQAFDLNLIRATHPMRMESVAALAQAGKTEEAFTQLELLANTFELQGNSFFINDPRCNPLHQDKRWNKYMDKLAKNAERNQ